MTNNKTRLIRGRKKKGIRLGRKPKRRLKGKHYRAKKLTKRQKALIKSYFAMLNK